MALTGRQHQILIQLRHGPWITSKLAKEIGMQGQNVSREIVVLKRLGYIVKQSKTRAKDLRKKYHYISTKGTYYLNEHFRN